MNKIRILLVSLLKPIDDTRMYGKLGRTLSSLPGAEIHVCGYKTPPPAGPPGFFFHPLFRFRRLSPARLLAPARYLRLLFRLRPSLVLVCTHELLLPSVLYKLVTGSRLIYDVQENYALNIRTQPVYPPVVRPLLAGLVRLTERSSAPFVDHFLLAERSYARELPFLGRGYTVVENKLASAPEGKKKRDVRVQVGPGPVRLLYSGTISRLNGVFEVVRLCRQLREVHPGVELRIIGYCPQPDVLTELRQAIAGKPYITLTGGDWLVPHPDILAAIGQSDIGLLPYRPHPSTFSCVPTKLFEYMGHALPLLLQQNPAWEPLVNRHQAGLFLDFVNPDPVALFGKIEKAIFYPAGSPAEVFWESEAPKVLRVVKEVLNGKARFLKAS